MKNKKQPAAFTVRTTEHLQQRLDYYAEKMGLNRNQLINNLLEIGVDDLRILDRIGMLVVGRGIRDLVEKVKRGEIKTNGQEHLEL